MIGDYIREPKEINPERFDELVSDISVDMFGALICFGNPASCLARHMKAKAKNAIMKKIAFDSVHWHMDEIGSRVVAKTGIPTDRHHLGKLILHGLKDDPDFIMQIDGATDQSESNGSALDRSVRCAIALRNIGLKKGDVMVLMGPNHIDLNVPHNAALYLGITVAAVDTTLVVDELKDVFHNTKPKVICCQNEKAADIKKALNLSTVEAIIVTFDESSNHTSLAKLLEDKNDADVENFQPADFDPENTGAYLTSTSGTTGVPKVATLTHKNLAVSVPYIWANFSNFPTPTKLVLVMSHLQWLSAGFHFLFSPILKYTRLQTSAPINPEHFAQLVNKYKPTYTAVSPTLMTTLTTATNKCDFTCFECILLWGSAVSQELADQVKKLMKSQAVYVLYGMSEASGIAFHSDFAPPGSCGRPQGSFEYRLVNIETREDITEANVPGELWLRGPTVFKGYYNNPEVTSETLTQDGWLKTGDIFYRDQNWNFFFVERLKLLLKYRNHQVAPVEIEAVIMKHPGVLDVAVTGIPDKECGDLVVACVVPRPGCNPTAQEIKDLVKEWLTDSKQLRGGVIFMKELPTTSTSKVNRRKIKEMALTMYRE